MKKRISDGAKGAKTVNAEKTPIGMGKYAILALGGVASGLFNGLLGAGGGMVAVILIGKLFADGIGEKNNAFANALCVMLPLSVLSCLLYYKSGSLITQGFSVYIAPAVIGGALGGALLGRLKAVFLKRLFAMLVVISGILMVVR